MEKIALITDSACDIDEETIKKYQIHVLPFKILYKEREFTDGIDITPVEVYVNMKTEIPKSSQPSMEDIENLYKKLEKEHYTHVISINISSGISGTVNAVDLISSEFKTIKTFMYDTKSTSVIQGIILKKCGELIREGKCFNEIVKQIPDMKKKLRLYFVFGTLEYAIKGGRIGKIPGTIGDILNIKPIVSFDDELGQCYTCEKIRGRVKSINRLIELGERFTDKNSCDAYVIHGNVEDEARKVCEKLRRNPRIRNVYLIGQISAIVGVYCGPGTVGICYSEL
ncbi:DegV family protein [Anaerocolumna sp. AGMB13020]|uniref:DegV family protein n=1 Tax=Anaerocolumna sp. AGMB13020 TaxID=3081750 RepID=UPI002955002F|nr:DegV family protein [Anaerocolumna sp. AGMB13020]WOO37172.1 DegV family protein [Anaerocolumna sp. AGMB13020]